MSDINIYKIATKWSWPLLCIVLFISCQKPGDQIEGLPHQTNKDKIIHGNIFVTSIGDTLLTGVPIPIKGKKMDPNLLDQARKYKVKNLPTIISTQQNKYLAGKPKEVIRGQDAVVITLGKDGWPPPTTTKANGEKTIALTPQPVNSRSPEMKDEAIGNLLIWGIDQGINSAAISGLTEDSLGNLWISYYAGGLSRFDGHHFFHYTTSQGLLSNSSVVMLKDASGRIWLGGWEGLCMYDGNSFTHYRLRNGLKGGVLSMVEDKNDHLWIGHTNGWITHFDGQNFNQYKLSGRIRAMLKDSEGHFWIGSSHGLYYFDPARIGLDGKVLHYPLGHGSDENQIRALLEDNQGRIWIGSNNGVYCREGQKFLHYTQNEGLSGNLVHSMLQDSQGVLWFGTNLGLSKFDTQYFSNITTAEGLSDNEVRSMMEDSEGAIWIGTANGLNRYKQNGFTNISYQKFLDREINSILQSRQGDMWFGLGSNDDLEGGISRLTEQQVFNFQAEEGLDMGNVHDIMEDSQGQLWIGGSYGVTVLSENEFTRYSKNEGLISSYIRCILEDTEGNIWIGGNGGASMFRPPGNKVTTGEVNEEPVMINYIFSEGMINYVTNSILQDSEGNLWFGTQSGATRFSKDEDDLGGTFTHFTANEGFTSLEIHCTLEDRYGNIWFGTNGDGVIRFDSKKAQGEQFTRFSTDQGLSHDMVNSLVEDDQHVIWVGTLHGLSMIKPIISPNHPHDSTGINGYECLTFQKTDGVKNTDYNRESVAFDHNRSIWWSGREGLTRLDLNQLKPPTKAPRIRLDHIKIKDAYIDFRRVNDPNYSQTISFGADLQNMPTAVAPFYNYPPTLELPFHLNHLTFFYSAIDWEAPHKIQYSYMIQGLDEDWSILSSENKVDYRNIPSGNYKFNVKAIGTAQKWSTVFTYPFKILPPWWRTWWAYTLYAILFLGGLRIFSKWRERKLRIEKENLEVKVNERTMELKDSLENLKSAQSQLIHSEKMASLGELTAGIAHEIQNPLNFVNNFFEVSKELMEEMMEEMEKGDQEEVNAISSDIIQNLDKILHHGKRADGIVKGMLQHSRSSSGDKTRTDINELADEYLRLAYHGLRAKDKSFNATMETDFDESIGKVEIVPQEIGRVLLNLITNAFYAVHEKTEAGVDDYTPLVTVTTKRTSFAGGPDSDREEGVQITVADNGNGIPEKIIDKIFQPFFTTKPTGEGTGLGLSLSYDIVKAQGGEIKVDSVKGKGTRFIISLPFV